MTGPILGIILLYMEPKEWEEETSLLFVHLPPNTLKTSPRRESDDNPVNFLLYIIKGGCV